MSIKVYEAYRVREGHDPFEVLWEIQRQGRQNVREALTEFYMDVIEGRSHEAHERIKKQDALFKAWLADNPQEPEEDVTYSIWTRFAQWKKQAEIPEEATLMQGVYAVSNDEVFTKAKRPGKVGSGDTPNAFDVDGWARVMYGEQHNRLQRDLWDLDVCVTLRKFQDGYYLIPYCDRGCLLSGVLDFMGEMEELKDYSYWNNASEPEGMDPAEWGNRALVWGNLTDDDKWQEYVSLDVVSWRGWSEVSPALDILRARGENDL